MATIPLINTAADLAELTFPRSGPTLAGDYAVTVVVVPDVGAPADAKSWSDGSTCWLSSVLPAILARPQVLEFSYTSKNGTEFSWEQLVHCGDALLARLLSRAQNDIPFRSRPLIFICHGLGGLVAKRTIGVLYEQFYDASYEPLIRLLSGVVFLGCPHPTFDKPQEWAKLALMLKASTKLSKKTIDRSAGQISAVANISKKFDDSGTAIPILSAFESRATKIAASLVSAKKELLVDESFAKTKAKRETMVQVDTNHNDMCNLPPSSAVLAPLESLCSQAEKSLAPPSVATTQYGRQSFTAWTGASSDIQDPPFHIPPSWDPDTNVATANTSSGLSSYEVIPLNEPITGVTRVLNLPTYLLKPHVPNPDFYGRKDVLQVLRQSLLPSQGEKTSSGSNELRTFALCGAGGLGKTQIAVEYAYSSKDDFDAIFFLQASDTGKLAQGFADIAIELRLETDSTSGDQIVSKDLVLGWLSEPVRSIQEGGALLDDTRPPPNWLLIFDNADDLTVLRDYWPVTGNGSILVTSRDPLAKTRTHVSITKGLDLEPFQADDAGSLLRMLTGYNEGKDQKLSEAIATKLSGLPLAITQIAGTISRRDLSFEEFLELYNQESLRLEFHQLSLGSNTKTLYTVWAFDDLSPEALSLLNTISFLDPDQIPEEILTSMTKLPKHEQIKDFPQTVPAFMAARTELTKSSLVKRNRDRRELIIHRIIQDTTRLRMPRETLERVFESAICLMHSTWKFSVFEHSTERWKLCEPILPHASNLHRLYEESEILKGVATERKKLARLFMDVGWYHFERGNIPESLPYFKSSMDVCDLAPEETMVTRGDIEGCLAQIASTNNNPATAIYHAQRSLDIFKKLNGTDFRLPQAHNESCEAYIAAGRFEEAVEQADLAIYGYTVTIPPEYADWAQMNKGLSLCNLGRYTEAAEVMEGYLEHREMEFGPNDTESFKTGQGLLFMGKIRGFQGHLGESIDFYLKALAQYHSTIGPKHFRVAALYYKLGETYIELGQLSEARLMFNKALQIYNDKSEYAAQLARTYFKLSYACKSLGSDTEAAQNGKKAHEFMALLGRKQGKKVSQEDLDDFIPNWSA